MSSHTPFAAVAVIGMMQRRGMSITEAHRVCRDAYGRDCTKLSHEEATELQARVKTWPKVAHAAFIEQETERGQMLLPGL